MIEITLLTEKEIPQIIQLHDKIFMPLLKGLNRYENKDVWWENYKNKGLLVGAFENDVLVGFIFFLEKEKGGKSIHLWMAGVDEKFRKQGVLTSLMSISLDELQKRGYKYITANTFPEKFPAMFSYLKKHFTYYKEDSKEWNGTVTRKVFFRKKI